MVIVFVRNMERNKKVPPRRFLKSKNAHAMSKIPFCDKDAIGRENKKCSRYAFF